MKIDGTSIETDSLSGKPISFSSINKVRTSPHCKRIRATGKQLLKKCSAVSWFTEHNWLKTGLIALYNQFDATVAKSSRPYARFVLSGRENLITGLSATIWLPGFQFFTEASVSSNKGIAMISGLQLMPVPGALIVVTYRNFAVNYQNWYGSGFISSGRNADENGIQATIRIELPKKWLT